MAYKRYLTAKTKNLFNLNCEWEYPLTTASELNLVVSGNTITGTALPDGASTIISMDKIPITGDKKYYISGKTNGHIAILLRLTDANGNVLTTNSDWDADYNSAYRAFYKYINSEVVITNANAAYIQVGLRFAPAFGGTGKVGDRISFSNVQFEIGSTATPYQPYGYLPSYKSKLKIAKVNQLLDKSKFPATATLNGVTITNNNDGSFTFTGGVTTTGTLGYLRIIDHYPLKKGHRYICPVQRLSVGETASYVELVITKSDGNSIWINDYLVEEDGMICRVGCLKYGSDTTPHTVKPILVDLIEMYGPQHMPTGDTTFFADYPTQVLDKTKFSPGQTTINGITITNNGDGTFLVAGTATDTVFFSVDGNPPGVVSGHTYLMRGCPANGSVGTYAMYIYHTNASLIAWDFGNGVIYTAGAGSDPNPMIRVEKGTECNVMYKPEFVDLTALGLDSTITSPEQLNPKVDYIPFVYDYAPKCWLTSYKHNLIATTKNLFKFSTDTVTMADSWDNTAARQFEEDKWYLGISSNNYIVRARIIDYKIERNSIYINGQGSGYGLGRAFKVQPNTTYRISAKSHGSTPELGVGFYNADGTWLLNYEINSDTMSFITPGGCKWMTVILLSPTTNYKIYYGDIQLEKGSTATDYVANGYV